MLEAIPDSSGHFGAYGGKYVPETLMHALEELETCYRQTREDAAFQRELDDYLKDYVGRPTPLYLAKRLTAHVGGPRIYFKREDLCHTGAHKINNSLGQALLAVRMGKRRIVAETGAGQHGVATATACALLGLDCTVYMGTEDIERQRLNVLRMQLLGAVVKPVSSGSCTLKDATNDALRDWVTNVRDTHYIIGSVVGPHPYPMLVRDFQSVIGRETREQFMEREGRLPGAVVACVGGGSNAMGIFHPFYEDNDVRLIGVEAAGHGLDSGEHSASLTRGEPGVLHGSRNLLLQEREGQIKIAHSISAGLDYPGVGPEHCYYRDSGRATYYSVTDQEALDACRTLAELEGLIPALETAHAVAFVLNQASELDLGASIVVCFSGRGDKDMPTIDRELGHLLGQEQPRV